MSQINWEDFDKVEMRIGTILHAEVFVEAIKPSYKLSIDFGESGIMKSSAQITKLYDLEELIGLQVVAVVNFPPRQIANFISQCLVLGAIGKDGDVILLQPEQNCKNGLRIG